jgi:AcrR family transcriptional regulator
MRKLTEAVGVEAMSLYSHVSSKDDLLDGMIDLREAGFSLEQAAHAYSALDSYTYGFALRKRELPFGTPQETAALAQVMPARFPADQYPTSPSPVRRAPNLASELAGSPAQAAHSPLRPA